MIYECLYLIIGGFLSLTRLLNRNHFKYMKFNETPKITVAIRKRPLNKKELQRAQTDIIRVGQGGEVVVSEYKQKVDLTKYIEETSFNFDYAYDQHSHNQQIYQQSIRPLIETAFQGAKISCFAYGQTGSGKTFTMKGDVNKGVPGLYYLGARQIFNYLKHPQFKNLRVAVSFYEIYCGKLYDLLNNRWELKIREDKKQNINIIDLKQTQIFNAEEFLEVIEYGSTFRVTSQNATNADSSRSHAILQITVKQDKKVFTKISFIDLAGNERGADHMDQNKQTKIDGAQINKSLLALKQCIRALDQGHGHIPFRGSKLTMVLKDSFVGFCKTVMIGNVSPNVSSSENTMNTLRYADRVKQMKKSGQEILTREEMKSRELMLPRANNKNCVKVNIDHNDDEQDIMIKIDAAKRLNNQEFNRRGEIDQKMDIEEPMDSRKPMGRKTENFSDVRTFNPTDKRPAGINKQLGPNKIDYRGKETSKIEGDKPPLLMRNVIKMEIDQNNLNCGNNLQNYGQMELNRRKNTQSYALSNPNLQRAQFDAMGQLRNGFELYKEDHEILLKEQMKALKNEMSMKQQHRNAAKGGTYEQEIVDINSYLNQMEKSIMAKLEIFTAMKTNLDKIKQSAKIAEEATNRIRQEEEQTKRLNGFNGGCKSQNRLHYHSFNTGAHFNGFTHFGDEQLLEGLPGDDSMSKLF